jgi:hypothetical protein
MPAPDPIAMIKMAMGIDTLHHQSQAIASGFGY